MIEYQILAREGLVFLERSILGVLAQHPNGLSNIEITKLLGLQSGRGGNQKNYLSWSILGRLMQANRIVATKRTDSRKIRYRPAPIPASDRS